LQTRIVEEIKTYILCFVTFFQKFYLKDNVEKCGTARQATDDNTIWCRIVICIVDNKGKNTHTHHI